MTVTLPAARQTPSTPTVFKGEIFGAVGKYARGAVLFAFERMGGPEELAVWATENKSDFYTKLFPKIIARESEVQHTRSVDDIMDLLDGGYEVIDAGDVAPVDAEPAPQQIQSFTEMYSDMFAEEWNIDEYTEFPDEA